MLASTAVVAGAILQQSILALNSLGNDSTETCVSPVG